MDSRIPDIARTLNAMSEGKLELVCRVHRRTHQAECYDLFETDRHGQSHWVMRFGLDEVAEIIPTVLRADRQAPGHDPVTESMRRAHEAKEREVEAEGIDVMWEFADRVEGVKRDLEGEKVFHGQTGVGESPRLRSEDG